MKKKIWILSAILVLLSGILLYAAGDLTVNGNVTINPVLGAQAGTTGNLTITGGYLTANSTIQSGFIENRDANNAGGNWMTITFEPPFTSVPALSVTAVRDPQSSPQANFYVAVKDLDETGFMVRALNYDSTAHTQRPDKIHWIAMIPTAQ